MGSFRVSIEVGISENGPFEPVEAYVDSGAAYSQLPTALLDRLGVQPTRTMPFVLADGSRVRSQLGRLWIRVGEEAEVSVVVFGADNSHPLLGTVTVESLGLAIDPLKNRLVPAEGLMLHLRELDS